ncbi:hypothetical protein AGOR_G00065780 [Albula goreensis]|uniref:ASD2 domain-containing protein n=1 Tax=Albula goreensis TaxID=1534307 RepID=A0A8T3DYS5_9TELE|nr:hypothetical protein AGOR_G00065780 [Albula goreensis]
MRGRVQVGAVGDGTAPGTPVAGPALAPSGTCPRRSEPRPPHHLHHPPARSDSFAVAKVHERGPVAPSTEGPNPYAEHRQSGRGVDRGSMETPDNIQRGHRIHDRGPDVRRSYVPPAKNDPFLSYGSSDSYNISNSQLNSNRMHSLSSTDVRVSYPSHSYGPNHQRQYSDESALYPQPRAVSMATAPVTTPMQPSTGSYYSSMQELPTSKHQAHSQGHARTSTASLSSAGGLEPDPAHSQYHCVTARQAALVKVDSWKGGTRAGTATGESKGGEMTQEGNDRSSVTSVKAHKAKYRPPQMQRPYPDDKGSNGYCRQEGQPLDWPAAKPIADEKGRPGRDNGYHSESHYVNYPPGKSDDRQGFQPREAPQDVWPSQEEPCPQVNPLLHSLPHDGMGPTEAPVDLKQAKRNDRYATTLRNEIQNRKAQLQKSRSVAVLTGSGQTGEGEGGSPETSTSSSDGSFSSTYKDHLKEVQARVLQATSFRRRGLEPEAPPGYLPSASSPAPVLPPEVPHSRPIPGTASNQMSRIGGRKRFSAEKKVRSFSEPDKIHEVGVEAEQELPHPEPTASLADRRKFFEATGKPVFQRPLPKQTKQGLPEELRESRPEGNPLSAETAARSSAGGRPSTSGHHPNDLTSNQHALQEQQQRLGTFAEYEATWNVQRKPVEVKPSGRYRSADNILDSGVEERSRQSYVHERSRSSPSADFYGQNIPAPERKSAEFSYVEHKSTGHRGVTPSSRAADWTHDDLGARESPSQPERFPQPLPEATQRDTLESRGGTAPLPADHGLPRHHHSRPLPRDPEAPPPYPDDQSRGSGFPRTPPLPKQDRHRRPENAPSPGSLREPHASAPSPCRDSTHSPRTDPRQGTGPEDEQGYSHSAVFAKPEPPLPPPPPPPPPPPAYSSKPTSLLQPPMDGSRSPSPQFAPQRLTDKPPISLSDDAPCRMESLTESSEGKKAPVRIVPQDESHPPPLPDEPPIGPCPAQESNTLPCAYREQCRPGGRDHAHRGAQLEAAPTLLASTNGVSPEEEKKREELTRDIVGRDKSLADILDRSGMRTTMDLMEGIFSQDLEGAQQRRKPTPKQTSPRTPEESRQEEDSMAAAAGLVTSSSYYSTSVPKAELLIKMKDMQEPDSEDELDTDLANKKRQLIDSLSRKLQVLREARESLLEDVQENNALGNEVEATVQQVCRPNELDKFRMFVGDLDKVVSLLLSLSGRLARVENALNTLEEDAAPEEKRTLTEKRKLLIRQHEDAKELKENLDRRERVVSDILASQLSEESLADFQHFVKMKAALIIEQRKLDDKIKLGEEQLKCLTDSLPLDQRPPF